MPRIKQSLALVIVLVSALGNPLHTQAAEIWLTHPEDNGKGFIVVEGEIVKGDLSRLRTVLHKLGPIAKRVLFYSPGGDAIEAMKIGVMLRDLHLGTEAPDVDWDSYDDITKTVAPSCKEPWHGVKPKDKQNCTCNSACFLAWLGGLERQGGYIGIHRPTYNPALYSALSVGDSETAYNTMLTEVKKYLVQHQVDTALVEKMMNTPSHKIYGTFADKISQYPAFYEERLTAKCGAVKDPGKYYVLQSKEREKRITKKEKEHLDKLRPGNEKIKKCRSLYEVVIDRMDAYDRYFGEGYMQSVGYPAAWRFNLEKLKASLE